MPPSWTRSSRRAGRRSHAQASREPPRSRGLSRAGGSPQGARRACANCWPRDEDPALTRSDTEKRLLRLVRAAGLRAPDHNVPFGIYELDTVWRDARLVVELDGYEFHRTRAACERDRARDAELQAPVFAVLPFTWRQVRYQPERVLAHLVRTLAQRSM